MENALNSVSEEDHEEMGDDGGSSDSGPSNETEALLKDAEVSRQKWAVVMKKICDANITPYVTCLFITSGVINFMVCIFLSAQDYDIYKDIRTTWIAAECMVLMKACSCTCCMLEPLIPCRCPLSVSSDMCSIYCPIWDPNPPIDGSCHVPGRKIRTMDSYWRPGKPSCIMKYHNSILVEYSDMNQDVYVASMLEVSLRFI